MLSRRVAHLEEGVGLEYATPGCIFETYVLLRGWLRHASTEQLELFAPERVLHQLKKRVAGQSRSTLI